MVKLLNTGVIQATYVTNHWAVKGQHTKGFDSLNSHLYNGIRKTHVYPHGMQGLAPYLKRTGIRRRYTYSNKKGGQLENPLEDVSWMQKGKCFGIGSDMFFSNEVKVIEEAKRFCSDCPVKDICLEFSLSFRYNDIYGVWGGQGQWYRKRESARRGRERRNKNAA